MAQQLLDEEEAKEVDDADSLEDYEEASDDPPENMRKTNKTREYRKE